MKFKVFYYILLCVPSLVYSMDEDGQRDLWAPRVEQAIQHRLELDTFYCQNSKQYEVDQKLLRNIDKTEKYILEKMKRLNKAIPGDFAEIITSIVDSKASAPLNINDIGSAQSAEERLLKTRSISFKEDAIHLLERAKAVKKSAFTRLSKK